MPNFDHGDLLPRREVLHCCVAINPRRLPTRGDTRSIGAVATVRLRIYLPVKKRAGLSLSCIT